MRSAIELFSPSGRRQRLMQQPGKRSRVRWAFGDGRVAGIGGKSRKLLVGDRIRVDLRTSHLRRVRRPFFGVVPVLTHVKRPARDPDGISGRDGPSPSYTDERFG